MNVKKLAESLKDDYLYCADGDPMAALDMACFDRIQADRELDAERLGGYHRITPHTPRKPKKQLETTVTDDAWIATGRTDERD